MRNTPLLLQLLFWYSLSQALPGPRDALNPLPGVFLCFRGLFLPSLIWHAGDPWIAVERPVLVGFGFQGGASVSPEFAALLVGLTTYTAALIGEIVRGGVLAVDKGQSEAAAALGLSRAKILRLVVLPQATAGHHPAHDQPVPEPVEETRRSPSPSATRTSSRSPTPRSTRPDRQSRRSRSRWPYISCVSRDSVAGDERVQRRDSQARRPWRMTAIGRFAASLRRAPMFRDRTTRSLPSSWASRSCTPASGSSSGGYSTPSGRYRGMPARTRAAPSRPRARAGRSSPSAFASSCSAPIRSPSSGGRPSPACCS